MDRNFQAKPSVGRVIFGVIVALIIGALHPFILMLQIMMPVAAPGIATMICVALYAYAGVIPAAVLGVTMTATCALGLGPALAAASLPMGALTALMIILGIRSRRHFFKQLHQGIAVGIGGVLLSVLLAVMFFGSDLIAQVVAQVQASIEEMMPVLWSVYQPLFESRDIAVGYEEFASMFFDSVKILRQYYELSLPGNLLCGAVMTGMISVFWGNWLLARRGLATSQSFIGLAEWYLPTNLTIGMLLTLVTSMLLRATSLNGIDTVWVAVSSLAQLAFMVQGFAAMDRRQRDHGASRGRRTGMIVLLILLGLLTAGTVLTLVALAGAGSALFGRRGAVRLWMNKNKEKMNGNDR